jgi:type I restriction enzyme S subunit
MSSLLKSKLPQNWQWVKLENICEAVRGITFSSGDSKEDEFNGSIACLTTSGVQDEINWSSRRFVPIKKLAHPQQMLQVGDILVSTANSKPLVGKSALIKALPFPCTFGAFVTVLRPKSLIDPYLLSLWLRTELALKYFFDFSSNTTNISNLRISELLAFEIPLPPLPEQRHIAAILRQADELRQLRRQANEKAQQILPALFYEMFGDPVTNPKGWKTLPLGEIGQLDRGRSRHRPRDAQHLYNGPYPFIQTGDIANSNGYVTKYSQTYSEAGLAQSRLWPTGTLCVTIAANIAKTAILTFAACFPDSIVGFVPRPDVTAEYVRQWFVAIQKNLEDLAPQAAQKNINLDILRKLPIPLPPKALQLDFLERVAIVQDIASNKLETSNSKLEELFQSLLAQAFSGELTAGWREQHVDELKEAAVQRDIALGLRGIEPTFIDVEQGRITPDELAEFTQIIVDVMLQLAPIIMNLSETLANNFTSQALALLFKDENVPEVMEALEDEDEPATPEEAFVGFSKLLIDMANVVKTPTEIGQSLGLAVDSNKLTLAELKIDMRRKLEEMAATIQKLAEAAQERQKRPLYPSVDSSVVTTLDAILLNNSYFRVQDLVNEKNSLVEVEEQLHLLEALGFVRSVVMQNQLCFRLIQTDRERALPVGLAE